MERKILAFADAHLDSHGPERRIDDYPTSILGKLQFLAAYAETECAGVLSAGDMLNATRVAEETLQSLRDVIEDSNVPWFFAVGQHEITGYAMETLPQSSLGKLLCRCEHCDHPRHPLACETAYYTKRPLTSIAGLSVAAVNAGDVTLDDIRNGNLPKANVLLLHAMVTPTPVPWDHITVAGMTVPNGTQLVVCGDYHSPFTGYTANGVPVVNPGALGRWKIDEGARTPTAVVISVTGGEIKGVSQLPVPHLPFEQVFDMKSYNAEKQAAADIAAFESSVTSLRIGSTSRDPVAQLKETLAQLEVKRPERLLEIGTELLEKARSG